jgi:NAD(P)-dependent dehydrogenase (short-subunit alcohol dehydrogenase family)
MLITGGTAGLGRAIALTYLARGDFVVVVGRDARKGTAFLRAAQDIGARDRAAFIPADLSLIEDNQRVIDIVRTRGGALDALVLCARHYRATRSLTADGFESTFASFYLSCFLLSHELVDHLERSTRPVIMNLAGPGGRAEINWSDLGLAGTYHGGVALGQGGKLNDLLGVAFARLHPVTRTRYVLLHPGVVSTTFSGDYDETTTAGIAALRRVGVPVDEAIRPILALIDNPPPEPVSAHLARSPLEHVSLADGLEIIGTRISLNHRSFDEGDAMRLHHLTRQLLEETARP